MKIGRNIFLLTLFFSCICFFIIAYKYDFSFYESESYSDMMDLFVLVSEGNIPNSEELVDYGLDGIHKYTYEYNSIKDVTIVNIYGKKLEYSQITFYGNSNSISYVVEPAYGTSFFVLVFIIIIFTGIIPALCTTFIIFIAKKKREKKEKV